MRRSFVLFSMLAFATMPGNESPYLSRDAATATVTVGTAFQSGVPFGRNIGASTLSAGALSQRSDYDFRFDRTEFQRVVEAARTFQPALSSDPASYYVDNFRFKDELYREGRIGMNLSGLSLRLLGR